MPRQNVRDLMKALTDEEYKAMERAGRLKHVQCVELTVGELLEQVSKRLTAKPDCQRSVDFARGCRGLADDHVVVVEKRHWEEIGGGPAPVVPSPENII